MDIRFAYKHLETSDALNDFARKKSEKISKFFNGKQHHLDWFFLVEKQLHVAHCHLTGDHIDMFAEAKTESMYNSVEEAVEHIEKQLRRQKELIIDKHRSQV